MAVELLHLTLSHAAVSLLNLLGVWRQPIEREVYLPRTYQDLEIGQGSQDTRNRVGIVQVPVQETIEIYQQRIHVVRRPKSRHNPPVSPN